MPKKKKETQAVAEVPAEIPDIQDTSSPHYWRGCANKLLEQFGTPVGTDARGSITKMQRNECAALIEVAVRAIAKQFGTLSRKCAQNDSQTVKAGMSLSLDRSGGAATTVAAHLSASEKWVDCNEQTDVVSPEQELQLYSEGAEQPELEQAPAEEPAPEE